MARVKIIQRIPSAPVRRRRVAQHVRTRGGGGEARRREVIAVAAVVVTDAVGGTGVES